MSRLESAPQRLGLVLRHVAGLFPLRHDVAKPPRDLRDRVDLTKHLQAATECLLHPQVGPPVPLVDVSELEQSLLKGDLQGS